MIICLVCSHGGHLTETLQLLDAFKGHEIFFATYHSSRDNDVLEIAPAYFSHNIGKNIFRMARSALWTLHLLLRKRPHIIISLGSEIAIPFFYFAKILGIKTVFIESWCRITSSSNTGRIVYPVANVFLVQWPQLLQRYGKKAKYEGAVV